MLKQVPFGNCTYVYLLCTSLFLPVIHVTEHVRFFNGRAKRSEINMINEINEITKGSP